MAKPHKVLSWLEIDELSACGSPAVEGAKAVILKSVDATDRVAKARADFAGVVEGIAKRDRIPQHTAMAKARNEQPNAFAAAYGTSGDAADNAAEDLGEERAEAAAARSALRRMATDIAKAENCSICAAMNKARVRAPDLFNTVSPGRSASAG
jgi:predicted aconitase